LAFAGDAQGILAALILTLVPARAQLNRLPRPIPLEMATEEVASPWAWSNTTHCNKNHHSHHQRNRIDGTPAAELSLATFRTRKFGVDHDVVAWGIWVCGLEILGYRIFYEGGPRLEKGKYHFKMTVTVTG
jgi:hypothetical protein